jgi:hypothetical protein
MARSRSLERREQALIDLYEAAEAELIRQIARDVQNEAMGSARYRRRRLEAIRKFLADLQDQAIPIATEIIGAAYIAGATSATRAVKAGVPDFGSGINRGAMELLADNLVSGLNGAAEMLGRRIDDLYRRAGLEIASANIGTGGTLRDATNALVRLLQESGLNVAPGGASSWRLSRYAEMVVRTNTTDAIVRGNVNAALEEGFDLVEVLVVDDEILCDICGPYAGEIYTLTDREGYETLDELPPFHPNCRCDLNILTSDPNA